MNAAILRPAVCLSDVINKAEKHGNVHVVANVHEPTIFGPSLVKNKPTWLHRGELKLDAQKKEEEEKEHFFSINIDRTTTSMPMKIFAHFCVCAFYVFKPTCVSGSVFHINLL